MSKRIGLPPTLLTNSGQTDHQDHPVINPRLALDALIKAGAPQRRQKKGAKSNEEYSYFKVPVPRIVLQMIDEIIRKNAGTIRPGKKRPEYTKEEYLMMAIIVCAKVDYNRTLNKKPVKLLKDIKLPQMQIIQVTE